MTETKYIFPKQPQSVAALVFIAVLLHINDGTNAKKMNLKQGDNFNSSADQYAVQYLYEKERQEFKDWISTGHLKEQLSRKERITYH